MNPVTELSRHPRRRGFLNDDAFSETVSRPIPASSSATPSPADSGTRKRPTCPMRGTGRMSSKLRRWRQRIHDRADCPHSGYERELNQRRS
jgi:hypothetical protein